MNHEEYLSRTDSLSDSPADVREVLSHVSSCATCRKEQRSVNLTLSRLKPHGRSLPEEIARWAAAAAALALILIGLQRAAIQDRGRAAPAQEIRYRIVGDASGVVAYTPSGIVVGLQSEKKRDKEVIP